MKRSTVTAAGIMMAFIVFNLCYLQIKTVEESRFEEWLKEAEARMFIPLDSTSDSKDFTKPGFSTSFSPSEKILPSNSNSTKDLRVSKTEGTTGEEEGELVEYNGDSNLISSLSLTISGQNSSISYKLSANDNISNQTKIIRLLQLLRESSFFSMSKASLLSFNAQIMTIEIVGVDGNRFNRSVDARALQEKTSGMLFLKLFDLYTNSTTSKSLVASEKTNSSSSRLPN